MLHAGHEQVCVLVLQVPPFGQELEVVHPIGVGVGVFVVVGVFVGRVP